MKSHNNTKMKFNLSEKAHYEGVLGIYAEPDIKEFIEILKYKMSFSEDSKFFNHQCDKFAGENFK